MSAAAILTRDIKSQMKDLKEKTEEFKARYSRSRESSPTRSPQHAILEQSFATATPDMSYQIFEDVKSPNQERMSGLQESLSENKARLAAILGVGMALEKTYGRRSITPDPHVRFSRSTSDADKKDQRVLLVEEANRDNIHQLGHELTEKSRQLAEKTKEADKCNAELQRVSAQLVTKTNGLTVIVTHVNAIEALITSIDAGAKSLLLSPAPSHVNSSDSDLMSPHSIRFLSMISQLSQLKSSSHRRTEELNAAHKTIEDLKREVRLNQLELDKQQAHKTEELQGLRVQLEKALAANALLKNQNAKELEALQSDMKQKQQELSKQQQQQAQSGSASKEEVQSMKAQLDKALAANESLQSDLRQKQLELSQQQAQASSASKEEVQALKSQLDKANAANATLKKDCTNEISSLQAELIECIAKLNEANSHLIELYEQLNEAEVANEDLTEQLNASVETIDALKRENEAWEKQVTQLQLQLQQQQQQSSPNGKKESNYATISAANQAQRDLLDLKNKLSQYQEELKHSEDIIAVQQEEIRALNRREEQGADALVAVQGEVQELEQQLAEKETAIAANTQELTDLMTQNAILEARITELNRQLKSANADLAAAVTQTQSSQAQSRSPEVTNKDKLISNLQIALDGNKRELSEVMTQNAALEANLAAVNKKLQIQVADGSYDYKNSEKVIASLESRLEATKRELSSVLSQNAALEMKISELNKQYADKRSPLKRIESEESMSLRRELTNKTQEIDELRDRNTELALSNGDYLEKLMQTENELNAEIARLQDHIAALNVEHESTCEELRRQVSQLNQQYYSSTARDAEKKVTFSLGGVRTHLKQNGVKFFLWEDFAALLKKVEELHNKPTQPVVCLAELLDYEEQEGEAEEVSPNTAASASGNGSSTTSPTGLQPKKSVSSLKSTLSKKTLLVKGASPGSEHSELSSPSPHSTLSSAQLKTPVSSVKSTSRLLMGTEASAARSVTSSNNPDSTSAKKWNSGKVNKSDPFGDSKKNPIQSKNSHKEMLGRMDSMKATSTGSAKGMTTPAASVAAKKVTVATPAKKATAVKSCAGHVSDDESVLAFDEEKDVY